MRIQTRLFLLLLAVVGVVTLGLVSLRFLAVRRAEIVFEGEEREKQEFFDKLFKLQGSSLEVLAYDYTYWDEMVDFVATRDEVWPTINLDEAVLGTYKADALWVYSPNFSFLYSFSNLGADGPKHVPLPEGSHKLLFARTSFSHFFASTPAGLMEVRGATIHPSEDAARATPVRGYFFAGRLWTGGRIEELASLTDSEIRIVLAEGAGQGAGAGRGAEDGVIAFSRTLPGWDGAPLARLEVRSQSPVIQEINRLADSESLLLLAGGATLLLVLSVFLNRWVRSPLALLSRSLNAQDPGLIQDLMRQRSEFGQLSLLIHKFFEQRSDLLHEIAERRRAEKQLLHDAFHDGLTGLANRALFMDRLENALGRAAREGASCAVLFIDLDRFKTVNDGLGHMGGDRLLCAVARRLERCLRQVDTLARLGGDEFAILLESVQEGEDAARVARRIQTELALPFRLGEHEVFTTASVGVALSSPAYSRAEELLRDSDTAMYRAKTRRTGSYELFDEGMRARVLTHLNLESDLRRALERQEFRLRYQPIVSIEAGNVVGFEALVRWQRPDGTLVPPAEFIPLAEETGLIVPIDRWVLGEACRQARVWQDRSPAETPLTISVNLSSRQFDHPDLIEYVERILRGTGLTPGTLKLEITESVILENAESTAGMLSRLRALGIEICLDDFGTGYSSLSYLHRFPIDTLKIDRSFASKMADRDTLEIVRTIVTLARNLRMHVVAEGVETAEQLAQFRALQCQLGQGYFFSEPLHGEAVVAWMGERVESLVAS